MPGALWLWFIILPGVDNSLHLYIGRCSKMAHFQNDKSHIIKTCKQGDGHILASCCFVNDMLLGFTGQRASSAFLTVPHASVVLLYGSHFDIVTWNANALREAEK